MLALKKQFVVKLIRHRARQLLLEESSPKLQSNLAFQPTGVRHCIFPRIVSPEEEVFQPDVFGRHLGCGGGLCGRVHFSTLVGFHDAVTAQGREIFVSSLRKHMYIVIDRAFTSRGRSFFVEFFF